MRTTTAVLTTATVTLITGYCLGYVTGPEVEQRLTRSFSEERFVGCAPIEHHTGSMLCGIHVVHDSHDIIAEMQTSRNEKDEHSPSIDCRVWKPSVRWMMRKPVHSCSTAVG